MKNKKYILNILLILIIGGGSIVLSIGDNFDQVMSAFMHSKINWILVMAIVMGLYYLLEAVSLWLFARVYNKAYRMKQAVVNALTGIFFNGITPFASGGQFAQVYVFNKQGIVPTFSASILLMCFICYQTILVIYTSLVLIFKYQYFIEEHAGMLSLAMIGFLVNFVVIVSLFAGAKSKKFQNFLTHTILKCLYKLHIVKNYEDTCAKIQQYLSDFRNQLNILQHNKRVLLQSCLCNFVKLTLLYSMPFFACKALNLEVEWYQFIDFIGLCSFIYMINAFLPIPGASGGSEGTYILLFSFLGAVGTSSSMFLWRFMSYYLGLIIGALVFSFNKEVNRNKLENIES